MLAFDPGPASNACFANVEKCEGWHIRISECLGQLRNGNPRERSGRRLLTRTDAAVRDLFAGSICGVVSVAFGMSFAALIFSGPLKSWLAYGIAVSFIASSVAGLVVALSAARCHSAMAGPGQLDLRRHRCMVGALAHHLAAAGASDRFLIASLIVMPISCALAGMLLCGLGTAGAGPRHSFRPLS
jgi:hypothetical protein